MAIAETRTRRELIVRRYPAVFLLFFIVAGIVSADLIHTAGYWYLIISLFGILAGFVFYRSKRESWAFYAAAISILGFCGFHYLMPFTGEANERAKRLIAGNNLYTIYGTVIDWPELKRNRTEFVIGLDSLVDDKLHIVQERILLKVTDSTTALQRGDRLIFRGRIYSLPPPSRKGFDYSRWLTLKRIVGTTYLPTLLDVTVDTRAKFSFVGAVDLVRTAILTVFEKNLSPTAAALAAGFLIGETRNIPPAVYSMFRDSGTLHLLAVSGSNVALVLLFASFLLRYVRVSALLKTSILLLVIVFFSALSYGEPSVIRASIMAVMILLARHLGRKHNLNNIIAATAVLILLVSPWEFFDVGFQLSFATAWGLIFIVPRVTRILRARVQSKVLLYALTTLAVALVAQICSMPLIGFYFKQIPLLGVLANLIVVPMVSMGVLGILMLLMAYLILPLFGLFVGSFVNLFLAWIIKVLEVFGGSGVPMVSLPESSTFIGVSLVVSTYLAIFLAVHAIESHRARRAFVVNVILLANMLLLANVISAPVSSLSVTAFSLPGGSAVLVKRQNSGRGDLIIANASMREYSIGGTIIKPKLRENGIVRVNRLLILAGTFNSVADILELAVQTTDSLYVAENLRNVVDDIVEQNESLKSLSPNFFKLEQNNKGSSRSLGIGSVVRGVRIELPTKALHIVNSFHAELLQKNISAKQEVLFIGSRWRPSIADFSKLAAAGYEQVICPKIDLQVPPDAGRPEVSPNMILPDQFKELRKTGEIEFLSN